MSAVVLDFISHQNKRRDVLQSNAWRLQQLWNLIDRYEAEMWLLKEEMDEAQLAAFFPFSAEEKIAEDLGLLHDLADTIEERMHLQPSHSLEQIWSQLKHRGPAHLSELIEGIESRDYPTFVEMKEWAFTP